MIQEEFVEFETAKLLKQTGFPQDEKYYARYNHLGQDWHMGDGYNYVLKPSQSVAMRWLREKKNLTILFEMISPSEAKDYGLNAGSYTVDIYDTCGLHLFGMDDLQTSPTYEAAAEAGIQAACRYLINKEDKYNERML